MVSDNGPQYDCKEMKEFAGDYCFKHITSSPYHPQFNGLAERTVKTVKQLIKNSPGPYKAMLSYRATPLPAYGLSPAELLMGRKICRCPSIAKGVHSRMDLPETVQRGRQTAEGKAEAKFR